MNPDAYVFQRTRFITGPDASATFFVLSTVSAPRVSVLVFSPGEALNPDAYVLPQHDYFMVLA